MIEKIVTISTGTPFEAMVFKLANGNEVWQFVQSLKKDGGRNLTKKSYSLGVQKLPSGRVHGNFARYNEAREEAAKIKRDKIKMLEFELELARAELQQLYVD